MYKKESLKKCNDMKICDPKKTCSHCLDTNNTLWSLNLEKMLKSAKHKMNSSDCISMDEIYTKSYFEKQNVYKLLSIRAYLIEHINE